MISRKSKNGPPDIDIDSIRSSHEARWRKSVNRILAMLVLFGILWFFYYNFDQLTEYSYTFRSPMLLLAYLTALVSYIIMFGIWQRLLLHFQFTPVYFQSARAWILSHLGKYVPGKITMLLVRISGYGEQHKEIIIAATLVEYLSLIVANCLVILFALVSPVVDVSPEIRSIGIGGFVFFVILLWPPFLKKIFNLIFRFLRLGKLTDFPQFSHIIRFILSYVIISLLHGLVFFLLLNAFIDVPFYFYLTFVGIYFAMTFMGQLVVVTPGGIGVREILLGLALASFLPLAAVIAATVLLRFVHLLAELTLSGVAVVVVTMTRTRKKPFNNDK